MNDIPFIGLITISSDKTPPPSWLICDGSPLRISDYKALYSILGTTYGGDGRNYFNLPDLRGRIPIGSGSGPGLKPITRGERQGRSEIQLTEQNIPSHDHKVDADLNFIGMPPNTVKPSPGSAFSIAKFNIYHAEGASEGAKMHPDTVGGESSHTGGSSPYFSYQPFIAFNYIISCYGIVPQFED